MLTQQCQQVQPEILQSVDVEDIESALRGCLVKLQYANASLGPCKEGELPLLCHSHAVLLTFALSALTSSASLQDALQQGA